MLLCLLFLSVCCFCMMFFFSVLGMILKISVILFVVLNVCDRYVCV